MEILAEKMSSEHLRLPPVSPKAPSPPKNRGDYKRFRSRLELPLLPAATKAERYTRLSHFDRGQLKRQKAHVRNALKTTENIQKISKQLDEVEDSFINVYINFEYVIMHLLSCIACM
jgi:hypothetical protein